MSFAPALALREGDREKLADLARLPSVPSGLAKRARMIRLFFGTAITSTSAEVLVLQPKFGGRKPQVCEIFLNTSFYLIYRGLPDRR